MGSITPIFFPLHAGDCGLCWCGALVRFVIAEMNFLPLLVRLVFSQCKEMKCSFSLEKDKKLEILLSVQTETARTSLVGGIII